MKSQETYRDIEKTLFHLQVEGGFLSIGRFLDELERSPLLTEVKSVEVVRFTDELRKCWANIEIYGFTKRRER